MRRRRNGKKVIVCSVISAICFGIVSYGHFYRGRIGLGVLFLVLTFAQLVLAVMNCITSRRVEESEIKE